MSLAHRPTELTEGAFNPAGVGYYPNLAELIDQKLVFNEELELKLAGILGDSRDVPDLPADESLARPK